MADYSHRPFSRNYSGLVNQAVVGGAIVLLCVSWHEYAKRKRRGDPNRRANQGPHAKAQLLGSIDTWEFGYLYNGRSWARRPSSPSPNRWYPLAWLSQVISFSEAEMNKLRGIDATFYTRFLRGCMYYTLLHTFTTMPVLLPIHISFAGAGYETKSMTRASISALVATSKGRSLLWVHIVLLYWLTLTWMAAVFWICRGAFRFRAAQLEATAARIHAAVPSLGGPNGSGTGTSLVREPSVHPHPHPQHAFHSLTSAGDLNQEMEDRNRGLRLRTVMVTNVPPQLRSEKALAEYFSYWLSRHVEMPAIGLTSATQPGFINKFAAFLFNRAKRSTSRVRTMIFSYEDSRPSERAGAHVAAVEEAEDEAKRGKNDAPAIDRVVIARKMTELASLLARREEVLKRLEVAHIKLARKTLVAVKDAIDARERHAFAGRPGSRRASSQINLSQLAAQVPAADEPTDSEERMDLLIRTLGPYVEEFGVQSSRSWLYKLADSFRQQRSPAPDSKHLDEHDARPTVWEALLSLPRSTLDPYQPLIHLSALFRGKTVPSIDYYTAKLNLLTALVTENRARAAVDYDPVSTAFVTFADPADARRACKYLVVHPDNPLSCIVTMAPGYEDLDWTRVMKSTYRAEFLKDWVVNLGVWTFTIFWTIPLSAILSLVSVSNIEAYWPALSRYLSVHPWEEEVIESFLPTLLISLLAITVPLLLLLIAKKAHTITTLSALHDRILIRYYKWLILNVLVFFCVGTAALQSFLVKFKNTVTFESLTNVVTQYWPSAGPFYVGWLLFTTGMHMGFELSLLGLPLIMYPTTRRQITPRKRAVGIRPRTFNYYYWLPNHLLIVHIVLVFAVLNPLVIPFALIYFTVDRVVIKNQLLHVYAKNYEQNGRNLMIRMVRYSFDGLILSHVVFLTYMVVLKKYTNVGLSAVLIGFTAVMKIVMTRVYRAKYEEDDIAEAAVLCKGEAPPKTQPIPSDEEARPETPDGLSSEESSPQPAGLWTWKMPHRTNFGYSTVPNRQMNLARIANPFNPTNTSFSRLNSIDTLRSAASGKHYTSSPPPALSENHPISEDVGSDAASVRSDHQSQALVTRHPPHPAWEDEPNVNHPYDNPNYTKPIGNFLWLPRDPFGKLDLDDTVNMHASLTSAPGLGHIGALRQPAETATHLGLSIYSDTTSADFSIPFVESPEHEGGPSGTDDSPITSPLPTGDEQIELPPAIAVRVVSGKEHDVEETHTVRRRASTIRTSNRRSSGELFPSASSRRSLGIGRPPPTSQSSPHMNPIDMRSFSSGSATSRYLEAYRRSSLSTRERRPPHSLSGWAEEPDTGLRPDAHAQATLARSVQESGSRSRFAFAAAHGSTITAHDAVVNEVIVEEAEAADERLRQEEDAASKATRRRPWWQAWMFHSPYT